MYINNNLYKNHIPQSQSTLFPSKLFQNSKPSTNQWLELYSMGIKSNLLKYSSETIKEWLLASDPNIEQNSIRIQNVHQCGQQYLIYITTDPPSTDCTNVGKEQKRYQYISIRGTKNWKNVISSLDSELIYDERFDMHLHSGYAIASYLVLKDILPYLDHTCNLRFTGHSFGGVVCCCIANYLEKKNEDILQTLANNSTNISANKCGKEIEDRNERHAEHYNIEQIVTFGMPSFSSLYDMQILSERLPLMRVEHINDEIARVDWNIINKYRNYDGIIQERKKEFKNLQLFNILNKYGCSLKMQLGFQEMKKYFIKDEINVEIEELDAIGDEMNLKLVDGRMQHSLIHKSNVDVCNGISGVCMVLDDYCSSAMYFCDENQRHCNSLFDNVIYIGESCMDEKEQKKTKVIHRMNDYLLSIEDHVVVKQERRKEIVKKV